MISQLYPMISNDKPSHTIHHSYGIPQVHNFGALHAVKMPTIPAARHGMIYLKGPPDGWLGWVMIYHLNYV